LKSAWTELPYDTDYADYIWVEADVPDFDTSDSTHKLWRRKALPKRVKLAMVGMHVAFSVKGHPQLIWATFEHKSNTPNAIYDYFTEDGHSAYKKPTCGLWLFSSGYAEPNSSDPKRDCYGTRVPPCSAGMINTKPQNNPPVGDCVEANVTRQCLHEAGDT